MCGHLWILHTTNPTSLCYGFSHKFPWVGTYTKSTPAYFQGDDGNYIYVIALGHLGVDESSQPWTSREVIANTTGLDAFIDGHSHTALPMEEVTDEGGAARSSSHRPAPIWMPWDN